MTTPVPHHPDLEMAALTDVGSRRTNNEDAVVVNLDYGLGILADGMGGYKAGEVASSIDTSVIQVSMETGLRSFDWQSDEDPAPWAPESRSRSTSVVTRPCPATCICCVPMGCPTC